MSKKNDNQTGQKARELEMQLKRALADYQNLERRTEEEKKLLYDLYSALMIEKFLPVLDNLEAAQKHLNDQGLSMVLSQFKDILEKEGVEEIEAIGTSFDPKLHEAIEAVEQVGSEGKVVNVIAKGYKINNKVIRVAKVAVGKNRQTESQDNQPEEKEAETLTPNE